MTVFQFGENWSRFASQIDKKNVEAAVINLERLLPELSQFESRQGRKPSFLDIGCGSGIHAVAATLLGANVQAFDIDEISVRTTNNLFDKLGLKMTPPAFEASILEVPIF